METLFLRIEKPIILGDQSCYEEGSYIKDSILSGYNINTRNNKVKYEKRYLKALVFIRGESDFQIFLCSAYYSKKDEEQEEIYELNKNGYFYNNVHSFSLQTNFLNDEHIKKLISLEVIKHYEKFNISLFMVFNKIKEINFDFYTKNRLSEYNEKGQKEIIERYIKNSMFERMILTDIFNDLEKDITKENSEK